MPIFITQTGGVVGTDLVGVKGEDGATIVTALNPLPVVGDFTFASPQHVIVDSGSVSVDNFPATVAVTQGSAWSVDDGGGSITVDGVFFQATQPVSGPLTDAELRASSVDVALPGLPGTETDQIEVGTTAVAVPTANLVGRVSISIKALAANGGKVYVRRTSVTSSTGWELSAGDSIDVDADDTVNFFAASDTGTQRVCVMEI